MLVLLWLGVIPAVQAQTFDKLWKQVEQAEKKSLPQTVIKLTGEIYQKGEAEKNSPQMLKAYMWRMKYRDMLTPDSLYTNVKELEQWAKQADKPMDRAILHSLIAGIYANYAANNQWQLRQRTEIVGEAPSADMREWTANMFVEKVRTSIKEAMADSVLLLNTSSRTYIPFVELGETSEYYHHDMYHLLAFRSIEALQQIEGLDRATPVEAYSEDTSSKKQSPVKQDIERIYENMLTSYKAKGDKEGCLLTNLNYLSWKRDTSKSFREPFSVKKGGTYMMTVDPYETGLDALKTEYKSSDLCAEVYLAQANYMIGKEQQTVALQLCDESIRLYPGYRRINALKNLREDILSPSLNVTAAATAFPGEEIKIRASHKNLDGFTLRLFQAKKLIKEQHFAVLRPEDYRTQDTVFTFQAPEVGEYVMRIIPDIRAKRDSESKFNVTRFKALTCRLPGNQYEVVTLDGQTGHPIPNAKVTLYTNDEKLLQEFTTGTDGKVVFPWKSDYRYLKAAKGADTAMPLQGVYGGSYGYYGDENKASEQMTLLTDRSLYRPGQTVYVKGIAYTQKADTANVLPNKEYTVILTDANNQEVGQKKVRTNEFGSFATDFALPSACLNGMFSLIVGNSRTSIRVEDYKRPTFDITFEKQAGSYQLGDQIEVKGKIQSYSGVLLQDLPVKYTVKRSAFSLWRFAESTQIASGEVTANENGEFTIPVRLEENDAYKNDARVYYRYSVEATATNVAGETQSSTDVISAGNRSLVLQTELSDKICKDKPFHTVFKVQNLNGQPVEVKGTFFLYQAKDADFKKLDEKPVATGTFTSNEEMTIHWGNLPSGPYVLKAVVKDGQGKDVTADANTILFAWEDKRPPVETPVWFYEANTEFDATHPAKFCFGTSEKDAYVMMNVFSGNELLESKVMNLSEAVTTAANGVCGRYWNESNSTYRAAGYYGSLDMLRKLPELLGLGCYLVQDDRTRRKLDPTNHYRFEDGTPAKLDGTMGQYMWCWNIGFYFAEWKVGNLKYYAVSLSPIKGKQCVYIPAGGLSALGGGVMDRTNNVLCSVVSDAAQYRGGNNDASRDGTYRTQLGMVATSMPYRNFSTYARKRGEGWDANWYVAQAVVEILFMIIFGTRNMQEAVIAEKDSNGLYQGGLGSGTTNMPNWDQWGYYPVVPTSAGIELGDGCGETTFNVLKKDGSLHYAAKVPVFFGLKHPFGHIWKIVCLLEATFFGGFFKPFNGLVLIESNSVSVVIAHAEVFHRS